MGARKPRKRKPAAQATPPRTPPSAEIPAAAAHTAEPPHTLSPGKKAAFAAVTVVGFFAAVELALALAGVKPVLYADDPYVGFASNIPLFVESKAADGQAWLETAPNKLRWFNQQRFLARKPPNTYRIFSLGGSTTYGRPYDDKGSFSAWLREILPAADPSRQWEVINAGGVSYASYRVAVVMEELAQYEPDLFVVYSGHNEFLEKRTYPEASAAPRLLSETGGLLSRTRLFAAARNVVASAGDSPPQGDILDAEVDTMLEHSVGPSQYTRDEEWRAGVMEHYRFNLLRMVDIARAAGAEILFVNPAADLRGSSPFKSEHAQGLSPDAKAEFAQLLAQAADARRQGNPASALAAADRAISLDARYAEAHFERAQALYDLERFADAAASFERALDEDICPLRILEPMQQTLRKTASEAGTPLVDFDAFIKSRSPHRITGPEYFLDHVHLNLEGYRLLALELLDALVDRGIARVSPDWDDDRLAAIIATVEGRIDAREQAVALRNLAKVLDWAGKQDQAARLAEQASDVLGPDAESLNVLGRAALSKGFYDQAIKHFENALAARPGYLEPLTSLGIALEQVGRTEEAMAAFRAAIESKPDFAEAHYNLGGALMSEGRADEAIASYREALRHDPDNAPAHNNLGVALASIGRIDEGVDSYRRALALEPGYGEARLNLGLALQAQGDQQGGAALLEQALADEPDSPEVLINVGNAMLASNRPDEALAMYGKALQLDPNSPIAHFNAGNALLQARRPREAVASYRAAARLDPASPKILSNLGRALLASGQSAAAVEAYERALALQPGSAEARFNAAVALGDAGRIANAVALYREATQIRPDYAEAYSNWGNLLLEQNRPADAVQRYERALALRPDFVDAHYNLGMALGLSQDVDGAIENFAKAVELQPGHARARHYLATSLDLAGRPAEALEQAKTAVELSPQWAAPLNLWAQILITAFPDKTGSIEKALELSRRAAQITDGRDPPTLETLAAVHAAGAGYERAAETVARAVELYRAAGAENEARQAARRLSEYRSRAAGQAPTDPSR